MHSVIKTYDPEAASSSGVSHVPSQPSKVSESWRNGQPRLWIAAPCTELNGDFRKRFESLLAPEGLSSVSILRGPKEYLASSSCALRPGNTGSTKRHGEGLRRDPRSSTIPTLQFIRNYETWNPLYHTGGTYSQNCMMDVPRYSFSELHFGKFPDSGGFQCWRVNFKTELCVCEHCSQNS